MSERIRQLERYVAELVRRVEETERRLANHHTPTSANAGSCDMAA